MARKHTPTILQMETAECGAAALGIILAYYGCFVSLEQLRVDCGISRNGSKAINMLKAARKYGMQANGAKADLDEVQQIKMPFIVYWNFNHFVVVEGFRGEKVYINDPATGPRTISLKEFSQSFTGVLLQIYPGSEFKKQGEPPKIKPALTRRLQTNKNALAFIVLCSLFLIIPGIIIPGFSKIFIDNILIQDMDDWFLPLALGMLLVGVLQAFLVYFQNYCLLRLRLKMILSMSTQFFWHILHLPMAFFYQRFAGDIADRINANERIANLLSSEVSLSIISLLGMVFFAIIMLIISWPLALIGIVAGAVNLLLLYSVSRKIADINRNFLQQFGRLSGFEMTMINSIDAIKANCADDDFFKRWSGYHAEIINSQQKIATYNQLLQIVPQALNNFLTVLILVAGAYLIIRGYLTVGTLVAFQALLANFNRPLLTLLGIGNRLQQIRGDLMRVDDVFNYPQQPQAIAKKSFGARIDIAIKKLSFGYSPMEKPLFDSLDLSILAGTSVAIIGKTGSGKSTLAKLICGLYHPWEGEVCFADHSTTTLSPQEIANVLSYVDQDIFLFEGTLRENLSLWSSEVSDQDCLDAIALVEISNFIQGRGGLEAPILERGSNFSGGQKQLIEIARALTTKPKILVLDEASANLDMATEKLLFNRLRQLDITLIAITHRLDTIEKFDRVIQVEHGKVSVLR